MTARSPHVGLVELAPSLYRRGDDPMCAQRARDGVLNAAVHKADSFSQIGINWQPVSEDLSFEFQEPRRWLTGRDVWRGSVGAGEWFGIQPNPIGVMNVPVFGSGEHYEFRIRTAWGASGKTFGTTPTACTVKVRIFLYPWTERFGPDSPYRAEHERLVDHVWEASFASTFVGYDGKWVMGATRGAGEYPTKLVLDRESTTWPRTEILVPNAPGGLDAGTTSVMRVGVGAYASVSIDPVGGDALAIPLLRALHMQGFVGVADG